MIEIDGSYLEGGGQIIRTATALSSITGKPCRIFNIRANRPNPGLQVQHLFGLRALAELCNAELKGDKLGSTEIVFIPRKLKGEEITVNIPTAGSTGLVFQILSLPSAFCEEDVTINIKGGATYGKFAPPMDYIKLVLLRILEKMNYKCEIEIKKHGFYPKGGAGVKIYVERCKKFSPLFLETPGKLRYFEGISIASEHLRARNVAERQRKAVEQTLGKETNIKTQYVKALNPGSGITIAAVYENTVVGADAVGERNKSSEEVGKEAAQKLLQTISSQACLDEHAADQILPFVALAEGSFTTSKITKHCLTNIWVIEKFLPVKFEILGKESEKGKIKCSFIK